MVEFVSILADAASGSAAGQSAQNGMPGLFVPMIVVMGAMFYIMYRNQKKEAKKRQEMLSAITKGAKVITIGGIHGEITEVKEDTFMLKIAEKVVIEIAKTAVSVPEQVEESNAKEEETKGK